MTLLDDIFAAVQIEPAPVPSNGKAPPTTAGQVEKFVKNEIVRNILIWQVAGQLISPLLAPTAQEIQNLVYSHETTAPLSPTEAALAVLRGTWLQERGAQEAAYSGISDKLFDVMVKNVGEPISIEQALFLYRRGKIDEACLEQVIRQSRVRPEYIPQIKDLSDIPLSVSDAVDAVVETQITYPEGVKIAAINGVSEPDFQTLVNTRGRPPGEAQLIEMVRRGFIPADYAGPDVLSLDLGIAESAIKTKWTPVYHQLLNYLPPPRTITALERAGTITPEAAQHLYQEQGLSPELAAAYSADASRQKTARHRDLTEAQVLSMYGAHFLTAVQATGFLEALGYTAEETATLLGWEDVQRELRAINTALSHLHTLYTSRKIGTTTLTNALNTLGVSPAQHDELLRIWTLERNARVATLTAAQIATAFQHQIIDQPGAVAALQDLGYSAYDAWLYLSQHLHQALPDPPPPDTVTGQLP